jgi:hypothetical protein
MFHDDLPLDVQKQISDNNVWWKNGQRSTAVRFLNQYSLHDSNLLGVNLSYLSMCNVLLKWDTIWINPDEKPMDLDLIVLPEGRPYYGGPWPYLCILFSSVHQLIFSQPKDTVDTIIGQATTMQISSEQRSDWLDLLSNLTVFDAEAGAFLLEDNVHCTTFKGTGDNRLSIVHSEPTFFLGIKPDGSLLHIPDLEVVW